MNLLFPLAFINSPIAWAVIALLLLLLFGRRLPGVARSLGQGITEFKKGLGEGEGQKTEQPNNDKNSPPPAAAVEQPRAKTEIDNTSV